MSNNLLIRDSDGSAEALHITHANSINPGRLTIVGNQLVNASTEAGVALIASALEVTFATNQVEGKGATALFIKGEKRATDAASIVGNTFRGPFAQSVVLHEVKMAVATGNVSSAVGIQCNAGVAKLVSSGNAWGAPTGRCNATPGN